MVLYYDFLPVFYWRDRTINPNPCVPVQKPQVDAITIKDKSCEKEDNDESDLGDDQILLGCLGYHNSCCGTTETPRIRGTSWIFNAEWGAAEGSATRISEFVLP